MRSTAPRKTEHIGIQVEPEFRALIEREARRQHRNLSCFVRSALHEQIASLTSNDSHAGHPAR